MLGVAKFFAHLDQAFFIALLDSKVAQDFIAQLEPHRADIFWLEMDNQNFFVKAKVIIDIMKKEIAASWDPGTEDKDTK